MSFTFSSPGGYDDLPPQTMDAYRKALLRQPVSDETPGLRDALELGVIVPDSSEEGAYRPVEPGRAITNLVDQATQRVTELNNFIAHLPAMRDALTEVYYDVRSSGRSGYVEHLHGNDLINDRIQETISRAEVELITAQPGGPRTQATLERSVPRDSMALERGVKMRTLYHATARHSPLTQEWARIMADKGGEIRTLDAPFLRLILVDRSYAFIQDCLERDEHEPQNAWAHLIKDPAVCAFLMEIFERDWRRADYWHGSDEEGVGSMVTTRIQRAILRLLASGRTQDQAARDLGLSTRTLQKHLTALRAKIPHLQSVPQMTYWWASCPDRLLD